MALQNIGVGNRDDAFYRYKMPKLVTKVEGRGNGIKTNLVNMVDVAKALARPPAYTTKYFGCELGAQSKFDEKTGISIVNGSHETSKLVALLEKFIKKYVQCYGCRNPETEVVISKTQMITLKCAACGFVSDVDMGDKLTTFILKNPPERKKGMKKDRALRRAEKERLKEGEAADEKKRKLKRDNLKKNKANSDDKVAKKKQGSDDDEQSPTASQTDDEGVAGDGDDDVQWQADTSVEAAQKRILEQLTAATSEMVVFGNVVDKSDNSPPLQISKDVPKDGNIMPKLVRSSTGKKFETDNELEKLEAPKLVEVGSSRENLVYDFKESLKRGITPTQLAARMRSKKELKSEVMSAFFVSLFEGFGKRLHEEISKRKEYVDAAVQDEASQQDLLAAIEDFCSALPANASMEIARLLKILYDEDILEEEQILIWYDAVPAVNRADAGSKAASVRRLAARFVDWLRSAEAESE